MENERVRQILTNALASLDGVKDALFDASREYVKAGNGNEWDVAKTIFNMAESADSLKRQIKSLVNGEETLAITIEAGPSARVTQLRKEATDRLPRKRKADYPKYGVRGDRLFKIGLGRDKRSEYVHEVPKDEFDKVLAQLISISRSRTQFTVEQVQEPLDCPAYQTYIVVAVLAKMGFLASPRRGSYKFATPGTFASIAGTIWDKLQLKQEN